MRIYTRIEMEMESGKVLEESHFDYSGPLALCDRSLTQRAKNAQDEAQRTGAEFGSAGAGIESSLVPRLEREAVNPSGIGPFGLAQEETAAESTAAAGTGAAEEKARLRALRTGNMAGLPAEEAAMAEGGARATGGALQGILARNAELKAKQQQIADQQLSGILGEDIHGQEEAMRMEPEDINTALDAEKTGWLQNAEGIIGTLSGLGGGAGAAMGGYARMRGR